MLIDLSKISFVNDFYSTLIPSGGTLLMNKIDEAFIDANDNEVVIKNINIEIISVEGEVTKCPCVIGLGNDLMQINSEYKEYEGKVLTSENISVCTLEVYE